MSLYRYIFNKIENVLNSFLLFTKKNLSPKLIVFLMYLWIIMTRKLICECNEGNVTYSLMTYQFRMKRFWILFLLFEDKIENFTWSRMASGVYCNGLQRNVLMQSMRWIKVIEKISFEFNDSNKNCLIWIH